MESRRVVRWVTLSALIAGAVWLLAAPSPPRPAMTAAAEERLARHRNLGKAFYENPTTQAQAVEQFRLALQILPRSSRERLNYGLALLRAGKTAEGIAQLEAVEKADPKLPHPYFNLGVEFKKLGENEKALRQLQEFVRMVPREPMGRYNLAVVLKAMGMTAEAIPEFERTAELDPNLAAARFQLFNAYRIGGRTAEAQKTLAEFQRLKKLQEGSATPEDVDWCAYSEVYDPVDQRKIATAAVPQKFEDQVAATGATGAAIANGEIVWWNRTSFSAISGLTGVVSIAPADWDNDGVVDFAILTDNGVSLTRGKKIDARLPGKFRQAVWLDYDHDYDLDLFLLGDSPKLYRNQGPAGFTDHTADFPFVGGEAVEGLAYRVEADTRGIDLFVADSRGKVTLYRDLLSGKFRAESAPAIPAIAREGRLSADFDRDGREDLIALDDQGRVVKRLNRTLPRSNWLRVKLTGVKNLKLAPYAEVEVKAGTLYQKKVYYGEPLVFDLRSLTTADTVRITWPNGLIQNEPNQAANREYDYKEAQRLSGSCPIIWTWDGEGFRYITDVLGVAPLGAAAGDGKYFDTDHDEYIAIPGEALRERDGTLEVRITEELSEVAFLDQVELIAVDHPADVAVYHNDKWKSPPYPEFRLWGVKNRIQPKLLEDPKAFRRSVSGIAEMHTLTMTFPPDSPREGALILDGWVDWADGSTFLAAAQESRQGLVPPILQARNDHGDWVTIDADMGMPAGKPKSIVVPVRFPSRFRDLRIVTNLCVYWTGIAYSPDTAAPDVAVTRLDAKNAELRFRGFSPNRVHALRLEPERFSYEGADPVSLWNPTPGRYTRYGAVDSLLTVADDRMVVMGSGDEVRLRFDVSRFPLLRPGWRRDYLLLMDGWAKDRDANTAYSQSVAPLPFHRMSGYPMSRDERHPDSGYRDEYNRRPALQLLRSLSK